MGTAPRISMNGMSAMSAMTSQSGKLSERRESTRASANPMCFHRSGSGRAHAHARLKVARASSWGGGGWHRTGPGLHLARALDHRRGRGRHLLRVLEPPHRAAFWRVERALRGHLRGAFPVGALPLDGALLRPTHRGADGAHLVGTLQPHAAALAPDQTPARDPAAGGGHRVPRARAVPALYGSDP